MDVDGEDSYPQEVIVLSPGDMFTEAGSAGHAPNEKLAPYFVRIDVSNGRVLLTQDPLISVRTADDTVSIDDLTTMDLDSDVGRRRRSDLLQTFPKLARRLELQKSTVDACLQEAQARRVSSEWSLESLDCGGNLSSMGMTVMMALILAGWLGVRVRVFIGRCHCSLGGYGMLRKKCSSWWTAQRQSRTHLRLPPSVGLS